MSLFQISSFHSFWRYEAHKNRFIEKILEIFAVWIDFTLARFDRMARSLRQRVPSFYAESNGIFGNFLWRLLKIYIQIKWIYQLKRDSLASLVHNYLFRSLITTRGCVFYAESNSIFEKFLRQLLKICIQIKWIVLNKKINIYTKIPRSFAPRIIRLNKLLQKLSNRFISLAQLHYYHNKYYAI